MTPDSNDPQSLLQKLWNNAKPLLPESAEVPQAVRLAVTRAVNAPFKLFRYILPSQLLAKFADSSRNALALQSQSKLSGSFDARSFCKTYITPLDRANHSVLGGSDDPGVGNTWRHPQIDDEWLGKGRRETSGGRDLFAVLSHAEAFPNQVESLLRLTLIAIAERLTKTRIVYPRPNRISMSSFESLVSRFLARRTGGRRLQAIASALFDTIGARFGLFANVDVGHVNKSDAARGDVADLDCRDNKGRTVLSVEVKDRRLSIHEVTDALQVARDKGIAEIIYLLRGGVEPKDRAAYQELKSRQFTAGHNIYEIEFDALLGACLILFGEAGRTALLQAIGMRIDAGGELSDRQAWKDELQKL